MVSRKLNKYQVLINNMPVREQACDSKIETWKKFAKNSTFVEVLRDFGIDDERIVISRGDLFNLAKQGISQKFIYATYIWGFPNGGRGRFAKIIRKICDIEKCLGDMPGKIDRENWLNYSKWVKSIDGLGIATYTKLLYFKRVYINGWRALILDSKLITVFERQVFSDFENLCEIKSNPFNGYFEYLRTMNEISRELSVTPDKLEMFLFTFGNSIKK
jgi:hypothetical protein